MYFDSVQAALHMEGHGPYVWSAYGLTLLVILALLISPIVKARAERRAVRAEIRRRRAVGETKTQTEPSSASLEVEHASKA